MQISYRSSVKSLVGAPWISSSHLFSRPTHALWKTVPTAAAAWEGTSVKSIYRTGWIHVLASDPLFYLVILWTFKLAKTSGQRNKDNTVKVALVCLLKYGHCFSHSKCNIKIKNQLCWFIIDKQRKCLSLPTHGNSTEAEAAFGGQAGYHL